MQLKDRVVLLTGGAGPNMGLAFARAFTAAGAIVTIADLDEARVRAVAAELSGGGVKVGGLQLDVSDRLACDEAVARVVKDHGRIDVLVNHAGLISGMEATGQTTDQVWSDVIAANLSGPFYLSRAALPHMVEQGGGAITNTISEAGLRAGAAGAAYTASKHGLVGLTRSIAWAYAKAGIRCNGLCPGGTIALDMGDPATAQFPFPPGATPFDLARIEPVIRLMPRFMKPDEIANLAVFLSSDAASSVNGQIIGADGGWNVG